MNLNPYKRPDYKNMSDAELIAASESYNKKQLLCLGINLGGAIIAGLALCGIMWPAIFPAIPAYVGSFIVSGALLSSTRFSKLGRECRSETHERTMARFNQKIASFGLTEPAPAPVPAPAPAPTPAFNHEAATVLDGDLEVNRPLQFKKKAPEATV